MAQQATEYLQRLLANENLTEAEAAETLKAMAEGNVDPAVAGGLLIALRCKGEAAAEIRGFATAMRELARRPEISISSRCGSADVLAALGLPMPLDERAAATYLDALGFTFLFAPHYHPAMKNIGPVRAALGVRTVFNILGPLSNPATPPYHVIGAYSEEMAELMAETLAGMDAKRSFVIHGAPGWDEATPVGPFLCFDVRPGVVERSVRDPRDAGLDRCTAEDLLGGEAELNAERLRGALAGEDTAAHRDALVLGAALALEVTGTALDLTSAVETARAAIDDGRAAALVAGLGKVGKEA
jgi:anthranilate phosphoribosyltransferase